MCGSWSFAPSEGEKSPQRRPKLRPKQMTRVLARQRASLYHSCGSGRKLRGDGAEGSSLKYDLPRSEWVEINPDELRLLLEEHFGGCGQYSRNFRELYLPAKGLTCQLTLLFHKEKDCILRMKQGPAFDLGAWQQIREKINNLTCMGPEKIGRQFSFSSFRVNGSWLGKHSQIQILPPPSKAPRTSIEMAEHPFILEFPFKSSYLDRIATYRIIRKHRNLTHLLNILLAGRTSYQPYRSKHLWAYIVHENGHRETKWVQQCYFADLGKVVTDELSPLANKQLEEVEPEEYYATVAHDGKGLRVPTDLDQSICRYTKLCTEKKAKFERAMFWIDMASRQWDISISASFASLVSAIETLTSRGCTHKIYCELCNKVARHDVPGPTQLFKDFVDKYSSGSSKKQRESMYDLRSSIFHGSKLMQLDQDRAFHLNPFFWNEYALHDQLWKLTQVAVRNWLKNPE